MDQTRKKKAVFIVDDDPNNLELLAVKLTQIGYRVITVQSGKDALELINQEKPGLVLLDIMMPEMNGIETLKRIKAIDSDIPVVMVTAVWDNDEAKKTFEIGAYEYITKPVDMEYLKRTVLAKLLPDDYVNC
ncbi:MAG: response regulator [Candidatus Marinimicrobia bacterium]|nr:response regulator [Candidatus Neomarinimicrobiota bacterium]